MKVFCIKCLNLYTGRIFLVIFYFTIALPFGLLVRLTQDPLDIHNEMRASWVKREMKDKSLSDAERSF